MNTTNPGTTAHCGLNSNRTRREESDPDIAAVLGRAVSFLSVVFTRAGCGCNACGGVLKRES